MERNQIIRVKGLGELARTVAPLRRGLPVDFTKPKIRLPHFESISVGTPASSISSSLLAGYRYLHYSSAQNELIELYGFSANFQNVLVKIQLSESRGDIWIPFYSTQMTSVFGAFDDADPSGTLPIPYVIQPRSKIQIALQNTDASNISNTIITLIGARLREVVK